MKNLLLLCFLTAPMLASANTPPSSLSATKNAVTLQQINLADSSIDGAKYLNQEISNIVNVAVPAETVNLSKVKNQVNQSINTDSIPASLPLLAAAIILFIFGSNRGRV